MWWDVKATPRPLYARERLGTHCIGGWVGPKAGLDRCGKNITSTGIRSPKRPLRIESLYRLRYLGPYIYIHTLLLSELFHTEPDVYTLEECVNYA